MTVAPTIYAKNLIHLFPGNENSSTITSEQDMYKNVPPAKLVNVILTSGDAVDRISPKAIPNGVAHENMNISQNMKFNFPGNALVNEILSDIASANLWRKIASIKSYADWFIKSPRAIPSKIEWKLNASIKTKGVKLQLHLPFFSI